MILLAASFALPVLLGFQNPGSQGKRLRVFSAGGYDCHATACPLHGADVLECAATLPLVSASVHRTR
jgi:hypothetical protein